MAGIEILALYVVISFFFISVGYLSKNKIFAFAGSSFLMVLSLLMLGFGYDVQTGSVWETNFTYSDNLTEQTNATETRIYTNINDNYTYAFALLLLIMSVYIMLMVGTGRL